MGLFQAVYAVGMSMFPAVVGVLAEHVDVAMGYAFLAAAALLGMTAALLYYHHAGVEANQQIYTTSAMEAVLKACSHGGFFTYKCKKGA